MKASEELYEKMFSNYISPSRYLKYVNNHYKMKYLPLKKKEILKVINNCKASKKILGHVATSVRGYYTYIMFYKD